jgi:hypothetical protein
MQVTLGELDRLMGERARQSQDYRKVLAARSLAAVETPVNKFLFDVALQSSNVASYAVSFAMAAFGLMLAHIAGRQMRQYYSDFMTTT